MNTEDVDRGLSYRKLTLFEAVAITDGDVDVVVNSVIVEKTD